MIENVRLEGWINERTFGYNPKKGCTTLSSDGTMLGETATLQPFRKAKKGGRSS